MLASKPDRRRRGPPPKESSSHAIALISDDPEIKLFQGFITGLHHIGERQLTARHLKLMMSVYILNRVYNGVCPNRAMIASIARIDEGDLDPELGELVDKRYLTEIIPTYGEIKPTYKLGSMGGTLMRHIAGSSSRATLAVVG